MNNMGILKNIYQICVDIAGIVKSEGLFSKGGLFFAYVKFFIPKFKKNGKIDIYGNTVYYLNRNLLFLLFKEIFIRKEYFFITNKKRPLIIDCGSNIGLSILFFKKVYKDAKILGFEPNAKSFEILKKNVAKNNLSDVELINCALCNKKGIITFYEEKDAEGSLKASIVNNRLSEEKTIKTEVKCSKLSLYINDEVDMLKMDIEGAEGSVILDLKEKRKLKLIKKMIIEFHHNIKENKISLNEFLSVLITEGFEYTLKTSITNTPIKREMQDILIYAFKKET